MSAAISAAKKRRAPPPIEIQKPVTTSQPSLQGNGLTLPQVVALFDRRLINLETNNMKDNSQEFEEMAEEYENRFSILANEISEFKG